MVDVVSPADRSRMMAGIRSKNSRAELIVRRLLFASGYRFRLHRRDLPGTPDIVMPGRKVAIFVHGCFWHMHYGCRFAKLPATRPEFWGAKLQGNSERDRRTTLSFLAMGWRVLWLWECATRSPIATASLSERIGTWIESDSTFGEIGDDNPRG